VTKRSGINSLVLAHSKRYVIISSLRCRLYTSWRKSSYNFFFHSRPSIQFIWYDDVQCLGSVVWYRRYGFRATQTQEYKFISKISITRKHSISNNIVCWYIFIWFIFPQNIIFIISKKKYFTGQTSIRNYPFKQLFLCFTSPLILIFRRFVTTKITYTLSIAFFKIIHFTNFFLECFGVEDRFQEHLVLYVEF